MIKNQTPVESSSASSTLAPGATADATPEVDLLAIWHFWRSYQRVILVSTVIAGLVGLAIAFLLQPKYRAETVLAFVSAEGSQGGLGATFSRQFGGLASLAGVQIGGAEPADEAIATLRSRALVIEFLNERNLLPVLFEEQWNADSKTWKSADPKLVPTPWLGWKVFVESVCEVVQDNKTGLVTLTIEWTSPELAADWANDLVQRANRKLRQRAIATSERNLRFLEEELKKAGAVEIQQAIFKLIESELKQSMVAKGTDEYAFKIIDPAVAPERKSKPKRLFILAGTTLLGFACAVLGCAMHRSITRAIARQK